MTETKALPRFKHPPVVEVALSVMIEPLARFRSAYVGLLWNEVRSRFPKTVDQPPLESPTEFETEPRKPLGPSLQFEAVTTPPLRTWFLNEQETELLQIQHDRIARNWRRANTTEPYPNYLNIRGPFGDDLIFLSKFLAENHLGELKPRQCEVTYVNHIVAGEGWKNHSELGRVLRNWDNPTENFLPAIEDARFSSRYVIRNGNDFVGRLHVSLQSAYQSSPTVNPVFVFTLTARGKPLGSGLEGALAFLELGHEWIVRGFAELTTPEMHVIWQREV